MGLGQLANAVVQIGVGRCPLAAWAMNCMGPQDATMLVLLEHGTQEQKERFLVPLVRGERKICFSMTERAAGSDATGMRTTAVRDGDDWVLNGEKWFSSSGRSDVGRVAAGDSHFDMCGEVTDEQNERRAISGRHRGGTTCDQAATRPMIRR